MRKTKKAPQSMLVLNVDVELKVTLKKLALMHGISMGKLVRSVMEDYARKNMDKVERYDALVLDTPLDQDD